MPITVNELKAANDAMLGNTNRGILFTTVNLSREAPRLSEMLSDLQAGVYTWEQFRNLVKQRLTVRSFPDFLDKFQPSFYYRLVPPPDAIVVDTPEGDAAEADAAEADDGEADASVVTGEAEGEAVGAAGDGAADEEFSVPTTLPEYEFSLEGGPAELGWRRVVITMDHPLFKNLSMHLKEKALTSATTVEVNVDAALWGFKPESQESLLRKSAKDLKSSSTKLMQEMRRNPKSPDTRRALEGYDRKLSDLENAVGDDLRVLPTITYGLAQARKALGAGGASGAGPAMGAFMLELGERARIIARPELPSETLKALPEAGQGTGGTGEIVLLRDALASRPLAKQEVQEIAKRPDTEQYPALVGTFMSEMIRLHKIQPMIGNMLAVVLQDPKQLATWNINAKEVEVFHDTFLGIYSMAVERFFSAIVPMFETLMGIYSLFNEFPADVRRGQPELIIANDELTDLWRVYNEELATFLRGACLQATNQYKDAVSFAVVPSVGPFRNNAPASPPSAFIHAGNFADEFHAPPAAEEKPDRGALYDSFEELRQAAAGDGGGFGRVSGAPEVMGLMQLGSECGFAVFFSPEEQVIAGRTRPEYLVALQDNYCPDSVVDKEWAVSGVLCLPDFVCLPPDGMLLTGKVMDGRSVGVEVPQIILRGCYVAAGRFMSNDNPEVLRSAIQKLPMEHRRAVPMQVRAPLPGIGVDLTKYPVLGATNLAPDHFLSDAIIRTLLGRDRSFLVFSHVAGQSPHIAVPRTLRRVRTDNGERYVLLNHWRQQVYLLRLFYAAYHIGHGGAWPTEEHMNFLMDRIVNWMGWYDNNREGFVNAFPSELEADRIIVEPVLEGGDVVSFILNLPFKAAVLGPLELSIE
jgi:hypothetical protein